MQEKLKKELILKVEKAIDSIRPYLEADGGNITVEDITDDFQVLVKLHGSCSSCSMSTMTLTAGVAEAIKHAVPEIKEVIAEGLPVIEI